MTGGLHGDRDAVRQAVLQLVGAKAAARPGCEQQPDDLQGVFTSHAEGSKRFSGFAAHASHLLVDLGLPAGRIRVERFGPTG